MYKRIRSIVATITLSICAQATVGQVAKFAAIVSPDKQTSVEFGLSQKHELFYRMDYRQKHALSWSRLGIRSKQFDASYITEASASKPQVVSSKFAWAIGETDSIFNHYNTFTINCRNEDGRLEIPVRVYDGSLAFRYIIKRPKSKFTVTEELTEFNLSSDADIFQYHEESVFRKIKIDSLRGICDQPATITVGRKLFLSLGEAENRNYTKCVLVSGGKAHSLKYQFYTDTIYRAGSVNEIHKETSLNFIDSVRTPWRTVSVATSAIGLHQFSQLYVKLVTPEKFSSTKGIIPGKVFRVPISTLGAKEGADFASKMNFQYIMLDAGWYGAEFRTTSDPTRPIPGLDMPEIIKYAQSKNIGVILYVNYVGLKAKLDTILPLFKSWGVSGIKFGFVDGGSQEGLSWLDEAVKKVNDYGLILNIHDHYKPSGMSRRYPVLLSQEGIRGDENSPDAYHNMVLPYTRFLAGPADFTFCYPNAKNNFVKNLKVSMGQQLALTVVYFDPLQAIFWYGKAADYQNELEIEFFKYVPTVWDDSRYLAGSIGENISVARRKGKSWFVGSASGLSAWDHDLRLDFLQKKASYTATIYEDGESSGIRKRVLKVRQGDILPIRLLAKSGHAIILRPDTQ